MFTINVSIAAENLERSVSSFIEHMKSKGHSILNCNLDKEAGVSEMLFTTPNPTEVFIMIEQLAAEDIPVPSALQDIYFSETVYSIHAVAPDAPMEDLLRLINHNINFGCILRRDNYRLRNHVVGIEDSEVVPVMSGGSMKALQDAINILSKRVLGTELLSVINKQEEVKWPIH